MHGCDAALRRRNESERMQRHFSSPTFFFLPAILLSLPASFHRVLPKYRNA